MSKKYLDQSGLSTLWNIITNRFVGLSEVVEDKLEKKEDRELYSSIGKINDYLYEISYNTLDYSYAEQFFKEHDVVTKGACSAVRKGNFYGRNYDWTYDDNVEFVVKTPHTIDKYATVGIAGGMPTFNRDFMENGELDNEFKTIPFRIVDGINEYGVVINTNVVPQQKENTGLCQPAVEERVRVSTKMLPRYVLDHFKTAKEAVEYLRDYCAIVSFDTISDLGYDVHYMVADENETYLIEVIEDTLIVTEMTPGSGTSLAGKSYLTNFYLSDIIFNEDGTVAVPGDNDGESTPVSVNNITSHGAGLERYNIIVGTFNSVQTKADMRELMNSLRYSNAYSYNMGGNWYSEFVGNEGLDLESPAADYEAAFPYAVEAFENRTRGDGTWQTTHSTVYDIANRKAYLCVQEQNDEYEFEVEFIKESAAAPQMTPGYGIIISNDNKISVDEVDISTVEYVDANISDTMNFIIQERDNEHAGRVAGDNLLQAALNEKQDKLVAGTGISIADDGKTISATGGGSASGDSSIIPIGEAVTLVCSEEDPQAEEVVPENVMYSCEINASAIPNDFWVHPSRYNFIVTIESTDDMIWGYTANHFCYTLDNYEGNWGITAICEDNIESLNVKHDTNINKDTTEDVIHIVYQGFIEDSPSLPVEGNICSVYLQKLS